MTKIGCIFCDIVSGHRPAEVVYQDERVMIFRDIPPRAPIHLLVIPQNHIRSLNDLTNGDQETIAAMIFSSKSVASEMGFSKTGFRLLFNVESGGGQDVFHLHLHLMAGG